MLVLTKSCESKQWHWQLIPIPSVLPGRKWYHLYKFAECRHERSIANCIFIALVLRRWRMQSHRFFSVRNVLVDILQWAILSMEPILSMESFNPFCRWKVVFPFRFGFPIMGDIPRNPLQIPVVYMLGTNQLIDLTVPKIHHQRNMLLKRISVSFSNCVQKIICRLESWSINYSTITIITMHRYYFHTLGS